MTGIFSSPEPEAHKHLKYYAQFHVRSTRGKNSHGHKITGVEPLLGEDRPKRKYVISGSEDHLIYLWKTQHEFYKFSLARQDRNDYYEAVKVHNAVMTATLFAPHPSQFLDEAEKERLSSEKDKESSVRDTENKAQFVISAHFLGCIKIIRAK